MRNRLELELDYVICSPTGVVSVSIQNDDTEQQVQYIATRYYELTDYQVSLESLGYFEDEREVFRCFNKPLGDMMTVVRDHPVAFSLGKETHLFVMFTISSLL